MNNQNIKVGSRVQIKIGRFIGKQGKVVRMFQVFDYTELHYHILLDGQVEIVFYTLDHIFLVEQKPVISSQYYGWDYEPLDCEWEEPR